MLSLHVLVFYPELLLEIYTMVKQHATYSRQKSVYLFISSPKQKLGDFGKLLERQTGIVRVNVSYDEM